MRIRNTFLEHFPGIMNWKKKSPSVFTPTNRFILGKSLFPRNYQSQNRSIYNSFRNVLYCNEFIGKVAHPFKFCGRLHTSVVNKYLSSEE